MDALESVSAWPAAQNVQVREPALEYCPVLHASHAATESAALSLEKRPASHKTHAEPTLGWYAPGGHGTHDAAP